MSRQTYFHLVSFISFDIFKGVVSGRGLPGFFLAIADWLFMTYGFSTFLRLKNQEPMVWWEEKTLTWRKPQFTQFEGPDPI